MAHIAKCIVDVDTNHISKLASHHINEMKSSSPHPSEKPFTWRMQQPEPPRKYQLFPKERKLPVLNANKAPDIEKPLPVPGGQANDKTEKQQSTGSSLKKRLNQHSIVRRRKVSVPELGPMTTVQEVSMDSPTIPGRPPLHERSISAPGHTSRKHHLADTFLSLESDDDAPEILSPVAESLHSKTSGPLSPKQLAPLVIPQSEFTASRLRRQQSLNHFPWRGDTLRQGRMEDSPRSRTPLTTPSSSLPDLTSPKSASTTAPSTATIATPVSASILESRTCSPKPWDGRCTPPTHNELPGPAPGHRRGGSESSGIMDRGRPRKRSDLRTNNGPIIQRTEPKRSQSTVEQTSRTAFERLPQGVPLPDAVDRLEPSELVMLQKQAVAQAEGFEILKPADFELLSRELRHLDERTEYLRRTYNSLRIGRRNLHSRICQYLRSPRVVKFSHESMLRQEEALAELDASIDDWVNKLDQAENRRMLIRQKLLEHVAAAAALPIAGPPASPQSSQQTISMSPPIGIENISTPPRSPSKQSFTPSRAQSKSPSPQRSGKFVPSTILEQPLVEEAASMDPEERVMSGSSFKREDVESIRVYAGDDVYALLADVENEISKMSTNGAELPTPDPNTLLPENHRIALHRQRSHEMLNGISAISPGSTSESSGVKSPSPLVTTPPKKDVMVEDDIPMLSNTVYKP
ncbi:Up-regulated during septation-domain-containing protein [Dactylonectria estremocensis]|uniref:Up-regulated during septation-domain-containing protein n=1 Tax=Dactylonectria estremocensis TaxID=1079267 RepID=A0A9P9J9N7_9HYPO|nr:Up-regulated during septation-domain-containing protein [Dactylonectria estremocensis]